MRQPTTSPSICKEPLRRCMLAAKLIEVEEGCKVVRMQLKVDLKPVGKIELYRGVLPPGQAETSDKG